MKRYPDEKSFSFRHIFHYLDLIWRALVHKCLDVLSVEQQQRGITIKGLSVSAWLMVQEGKAHGHFNGTSALHASRARDESFSPRNWGAECKGVSASSALSGCNTESRAVLISPSLDRDWFATETTSLEQNGTPSCRKKKKKRGNHLWSHCQACPIKRTSGCTVRHQVHLPAWGSCVSSPLQCAWTPTRAPEPVCATVLCAVLLPKHRTSWFIHFTLCKNVIKLHHTDKY